MDNSIHILVAEDDSDISQLLCSIIRKSGYVPQPAFSGTEALLYLEQRQWSMVLLDLMLPGMTGEELLKRIDGRRNGPVIIISAKGEQHTKVSALRGGRTTSLRNRSISRKCRRESIPICVGLRR